MWRSSLSVSTTSATAPPQCRECAQSLAAVQLSAVREDAEEGTFSLYHLHPQCATPTLLSLTVPLGAIERIDGYDGLPQASQVSLFTALPPLLRLALVLAMEEAARSPLRQVKSLTDPNPPASVVCPGCALLLHEPVSMPCCDYTLCSLCWKAAHLKEGAGAELCTRAQACVTALMDCVGPGCTKTVHIGRVDVDAEQQKRLQLLVHRCPTPPCTETFALKDADEHSAVCLAVKLTCGTCHEVVKRGELVQHALACAGEGAVEMEEEKASGEDEDEEKDGEEVEERENDGVDVEGGGAAEAEGESGLEGGAGEAAEQAGGAPSQQGDMEMQ